MKISSNVVKGFTTATLCTVWMFISIETNLLGWAGFAGCTAYFASNKSGKAAVIKTLPPILSGSLYALLAIYVCSKVDTIYVLLSMTFITTLLMCVASPTKLLGFVPAAFIGSFSTFAANGNPTIVIALVIGVALGFACDTVGTILSDKI